jgi:hypothetical protein
VLPIVSRVLFAVNLLPVLQRATSLKRVVSVFTASYEGSFDDYDWDEFAIKKPLKARPHLSSMITMANNVLARQAPDVSFVHNFPGSVKTELGKDAKGGIAGLRNIFKLFAGFRRWLPAKDCGALQLYGATSARFPPATGDAAGSPLPDGISIARGTDGKPGSGSYSIDVNCEVSSSKVEQHLAKVRADGAEEKLWSHMLAEIERITGKARQISGSPV